MEKIRNWRKNLRFRRGKGSRADTTKESHKRTETMTFNLLPLKYQWAYDLYRKMKANHWK